MSIGRRPWRLACLLLATAIAVVVVGACSATPARRPASAGTASRVADGAGSTVRPPPEPAASPSSSAAVVSPLADAGPRPVSPCARNHHPQLVVVDISDQRMWLCSGTRTALATPVTTGRTGHGDSTPTGHFRIQGVNPDTSLDLGGHYYDVHYWIPFKAPMFGFHDAGWQKIPFGSQQYRTAGSHGCVHMPLPAIKFFARWAHNWANRSIPVHITA